MEVPGNDFDLSLSSQIDQARALEEHYRALLLFWKQRRQRLEQQISSPIDEASEIAENAFNAASNTNQN